MDKYCLIQPFREVKSVFSMEKENLHCFCLVLFQCSAFFFFSSEKKAQVF